MSGPCNRALDVIQNIRGMRERLHSADRTVSDEQKANFTAYGKSKSKPKSWTAKFVCLSDKDTRKVPHSKYKRSLLIEGGLGEKK